MSLLLLSYTGQCACVPVVYTECSSTYRICPNRSPGFYFFPASFDHPASIQARLLLNYMKTGYMIHDLACYQIILRDTSILRVRSSSIQPKRAFSKSTSSAFLPAPHYRLRNDAPFFFKLVNICFCLHHSWIILLSMPISHLR